MSKYEWKGAIEVKDTFFGTVHFVRREDAEERISELEADNKTLRRMLEELERERDHYKDLWLNRDLSLGVTYRDRELEQQVNHSCRWKPLANDVGFHIGCGGETAREDAPDYCPWCGGKVVSDDLC